jgi:hypothetical protein
MMIANHLKRVAIMLTIVPIVKLLRISPGAERNPNLYCTSGADSSIQLNTNRLVRTWL